jgi:3-(methylthio)propionyl---CoA ligase
MLSLMMDVPLLISAIIDHAAEAHGNTEIVSRTIEGGIFRYDYRRARARAIRLASALTRLGVGKGDRVGSLAWNTHHHLELFYGVSGMGAVLHTANPRLFREQLAWVVNHAADRYLFIDAQTLPIAEVIAPLLQSVQGFIYMTAGDQLPGSRLPNLLSYETLLAAEGDDYVWPEFDERSASTLCYTSGTTGNPKGVLYSHRAATLSALSYSMADTFGGYRQGMLEAIMPITPMFHGNAWQMPYTAPMNGYKLVLPGCNFEPAKLYELIETEGVTLTAGVPAVWQSLVDYLDDAKLGFSTLRATLMSGSKPSRLLLEKLEGTYGIAVSQIWGMTEAPATLKGSLYPGLGNLRLKERVEWKLKQGRLNFGTRFRIVDATGTPLPHDGKAIGRLLARGPWIAKNYYRQNEGDFEWLDTGDVARIRPDGYVEVTDRAKDVIKSGGEWISSVELENAAMEHPDVQCAAVIAIPHQKWDERPLMLVVGKPGTVHDPGALRAHLASRIVSWWLPDAILYVDDIPLTAAGKVHKLALREQYRDYKGTA